jgi:hypothetical protein
MEILNVTKMKKPKRTLEQQIADLNARKDRDEAKATIIDAAEKLIAAARKHDVTTVNHRMHDIDAVVSNALGLKSKQELQLIADGVSVQAAE